MGAIGSDFSDNNIWTKDNSVEALVISFINRQTENELEGVLELKEAVIDKERFYAFLQLSVEGYLSLQHEEILESLEGK